MGQRADQYAVSVTIDGVNTGVWDKMSGGELDSEETKYKPGGLGSPISLGGSINPGNVTVSRLFDKDRDQPAAHGWLARVGKAAVTVTKQPLDVDGNTYGAPMVYSGTLKMVTPPEVDSESSDPALIELEVSTDATIT